MQCVGRCRRPVVVTEVTVVSVRRCHSVAETSGRCANEFGEHRQSMPTAKIGVVTASAKSPQQSPASPLSLLLLLLPRDCAPSHCPAGLCIATDLNIRVGPAQSVMGYWPSWTRTEHALWFFFCTVFVNGATATDADPLLILWQIYVTAINNLSNIKLFFFDITSWYMPSSAADGKPRSRNTYTFGRGYRACKRMDIFRKR